MFWVEVETLIVLLGILEELWERIVVEELGMIVLDVNCDVGEIDDDGIFVVEDSIETCSVVESGWGDVELEKDSLVDETGTVIEAIGVVDRGVVVVVGGGGGITSTLLDIDAVRGYRLGFLLSAWQVIDVIWSKAGSYEKTTCKIWLHNRVFGSHEPDVMLFWPFDREMLVLESNRLNETSGFDPTLLHLIV